MLRTHDVLFSFYFSLSKENHLPVLCLTLITSEQLCMGALHALVQHKYGACITSDVYIGTYSSHRPLCLCLSLGIRHFCTEQQHSVHCAACKTEYILLAFLHI